MKGICGRSKLHCDEKYQYCEIAINPDGSCEPCNSLCNPARHSQSGYDDGNRVAASCRKKCPKFQAEFKAEERVRNIQTYLTFSNLDTSSAPRIKGKSSTGSDKGESDANLMFAVLAVVILIFTALVIVIVIQIWKYCRKNKNLKKNSEENGTLLTNQTQANSTESKVKSIPSPTSEVKNKSQEQGNTGIIMNEDVLGEADYDCQRNISSFMHKGRSKSVQTENFPVQASEHPDMSELDRQAHRGTASLPEQIRILRFQDASDNGVTLVKGHNSPQTVISNNHRSVASNNHSFAQGVDED